MHQWTSLALALMISGFSPVRPPSHQPPSGPFLVILDSAGRTRGGTALLDKAPDKPDETPAGVVVMSQSSEVKTPDGQVVTGFGFNAWKEGGGARVVVVMLVPKAGIANTYLPDRRADLKQVRLASFTISIDETRVLEEMAPLKTALMSVRLDAKVRRPGR